MIELKALHVDAVDSAQEKALRYRLLNQPRLAESICRDILAVKPDNRDTLITLVLCLTDQFGTSSGATVKEAMEWVGKLPEGFERDYYAGIVCERKALAQLRMAGPASGHLAYDWFRRAMRHFEAAEAASDDTNDDGLLRWNTCARIINSRADICEAPHDPMPAMLE